MKMRSRYASGKRNAVAKVYRDDSSVQKLPWRNPLKGDERKAAMAEVKVAHAGLFVGFRMKF
jgi:hypothetical protein